MTSETLYILGRIKTRIINAAEDIIIDENNDWDYNQEQEAIKEGLYQALSIVQEYCDKGGKQE